MDGGFMKNLLKYSHWAAFIRFFVTRKQERILLLSIRGFTLIEVLVATAIFSIMTAIAIPTWGMLVPVYQLSSAARQVATEFDSARNRAVTQYRRFRVVFLSSTTYRVERENTPGAADYVTFKGPRTLPSGITASFSATPIFQTRGDASPAGNITLTNSKGDTKLVTVSSTGGVDIQ
jgi:prepilin-type N-terminal cleavage/methylation domain-containing protein